MSHTVAPPADKITEPRRIQRQRAKGWRMPPNTVYVGRPTVYGNDWDPRDADAYWVPRQDWKAWAVAKYREDFERRGWIGYIASERFMHLGEIQAALRGKNLACWCPLDEPCHADVLLEIANPSSTPSPSSNTESGE